MSRLIASLFVASVALVLLAFPSLPGAQKPREGMATPDPMPSPPAYLDGHEDDEEEDEEEFDEFEMEFGEWEIAEVGEHTFKWNRLTGESFVLVLNDDMAFWLVLEDMHPQDFEDGHDSEEGEEHDNDEGEEHGD